MKASLFCLLLCLCFAHNSFSQKRAYIPNYMRDTTDVNGKQFSWDKTYQDSNFCIIWGDGVGTDPKNYSDPNLAFDPAYICSFMEDIYAKYKAWGFLIDSPGTNVSKYKFPIIMLGTFGADGIQGWAFGGDPDGVMGTFWAAPNAMRGGGVAAHEFTHSLQAQVNIDYRTPRNLGPVWINSGIFWETHANLMRNLMYPGAVSAWGMDRYHTEEWGDWKNAYESYAIMMAIMADDGDSLTLVDRIWRESYSTEMPMQAFKRISGLSQPAFNDKMYRYARRMATYDYPYDTLGIFFRRYRNDDLNWNLNSVQCTYSILSKVPGSVGHYRMKIEESPEEFAYNVIPLYSTSDSCPVIVKFKGNTDVNSHAGWRYGFAAAHPNGTISRYSDIYNENTSVVSFQLQGDETNMYLVVMGAPNDSVTIQPGRLTWDGYPKKFKFPYELTIKNGVPEGYQKASEFRKQLKRGDGHLHPNGGGWIENSAKVASTVFVDSCAMVLGNSKLSGNVKILNTALVRDAVMKGNVRILDNAFVVGGSYRDSAAVKGRAYAENDTLAQNASISMRAILYNNRLYGNVEVGGDVLTGNGENSCNKGAYYVLTNYYSNKPIPCDGSTPTSPANKDINNTNYTVFSDTDMAVNCNCKLTPECNSSVLPVSFLSFRAEKGAVVSTALLSWKVANSVNSNHFKIERSADGGLSFSALSNVKALDGSSQQSYTYTDVSIPSGTVYYRIRQVDNDGKITYSNIAKLTFDGTGLSWSVSPNPASDHISILFGKGGSNVRITITGTNGRVVYRKPVSSVGAGSRLDITLGRFAKGVYLLQLETDGNLKTEKIVKN